MNAKDKARALYEEFVRVKFPRHHNFRREMKRVLECSPLLKTLGIS